MASIYDWSMVAANNGAADAQINYSEGMPPSAVNNSARQAMARNAELLGDIGGALTAGGTADALTVTANSSFTAYANGQVLALRIATDNTGAATLNVNGIGAKSIRKMLSSGESALTGAELQATGIYLLMYQSALNAAAGAWLLLNPTMDLSAYVTLTGTQTLTNKTLTSPAINTPTITGGSGSGMTLTTATLTTPTLTLKQSAAPAPTAEGDIQWDTDDDRIVIGDSVAQKIFSSNPATTVDNTVPRFDGLKGATQTSGVTISDTNAVTAAGGYYVGSVRVGGAPDAVLEDQKATGTDGGTFSSGAWMTRTLNTEVFDPAGLIALAANRFTPTVAGWVEWSAPSCAVGTNIQTRLQNITDGTTAAMGVSDNNRASSTAPGLGGGPVVAGKAYEIQHQCDAGAVTEGFGIASGFGSHEVYTRVKFWRTA
ncbi:MAG: hypothetical protein E5Y88_12355 [Mesorhizobium sp.]|uniref:hypothetical protein n=1 Tax=Mesorhizobium sp. TaxID=1871066 RepID=UPI00120B3377|nr:hypothetical protein [Mesorhizobium sp.]TIL25733.1 MAG: hypothetical protein E5Y88_12355 [Mesorhizobium sp.]